MFCFIFLLGHKILVTELMARICIRNVKLLPCLIKHYSMKEYSVGVGVSSRHETDRGEWSWSCHGCFTLG